MSARTFSAGDRERGWQRLEAETFDLLVIGGGVTGAGIARDAAGRGLSVALVEEGDIGGGTSSRSSRLVHGGLRYLETLDFNLVFEALRERRRLLELAPHLVRPLPFLFPVYRGDPTSLPKLMAGMWLYESLSLFRAPRRHRALGRGGVASEEPNLRVDGLTGGAIYYDAQVDDVRLTIAIARAAHEAGATVVPRARATAIRAAAGAPADVDVADALGGRAAVARARVVVNAGGPWSDRVRALADPAVRPRLRMTKGAHILVRRDRVGNRNAIIFRSAVDGRVMFVLPWGDDFTYVGTTDTEYEGDPGDAVADADDVDYLIRSVNAVFPDAKLDAGEVISTWAGVRPLLAPGRSRTLSASATSREHSIWRDTSGLLNVAGGKLTTYRSMAAEVVDVAAGLLRREFGVQSGECYTEFLPLPGAPGDEGDTLAGRIHRDAAALGIDGATAASLVRTYGTDAGAVLALVAEEPELRERIDPERPYLYAEAVHAVRGEMALTLEDVLRRRTQLFYEATDGALGAARQVAERIGGEAGLEWDAAEIDRQVERYADAVRATRPGRAG